MRSPYPTAKEFDKRNKPLQYIIPVAIPARNGCSKSTPKRCNLMGAELRKWAGGVGVLHFLSASFPSALNLNPVVFL